LLYPSVPIILRALTTPMVYDMKSTNFEQTASSRDYSPGARAFAQFGGIPGSRVLEEIRVVGMVNAP